MEFKIIEGRTFERIKRCLHELVERSKKLSPSRIEDEWWDNQDVCRILNISKRTLQTYRDNGTLAYTQINHKIFYKPEDVEAVINKLKSK